MTGSIPDSTGDTTAAAHRALPTRFVFIDSNVVLEGRQLTALPWDELPGSGRILVLCTPTMLNEVDAKKHDGRLGEHARAFNRLIRPVALSGTPASLATTPVPVELAIATVGKVPWADFNHLDRDDGDSRIVLESLLATEPGESARHFLSHDTRAIALAAREGLDVLDVPDHWLRPRESSPMERELRRTKERVRELETSQPTLDVDVRFLFADAVVYRVEMTPADVAATTSWIVADHPRPKDVSDFTVAWAGRGPMVTDGQYHRYLTEEVPAFVARYPALLEEQFGQYPFELHVENTGNIQAEHLVLTITLSRGWFNDRVVAHPLGGPPLIKEASRFDPLDVTRHFRPPFPGHHEMRVTEGPDRGRRMVVQCRDFRHGERWIFEGVIFLDPADGPPVAMTVTATAANLRGEIRAVGKPAYTVVSVPPSFLEGERAPDSWALARISKAVDDDNIDAVDWSDEDD